MYLCSSRGTSDLLIRRLQDNACTEPHQLFQHIRIKVQTSPGSFYFRVNRVDHVMKVRDGRAIEGHQPEVKHDDDTTLYGILEFLSV
jgi:hypothetical protein